MSFEGRFPISRRARARFSHLAFCLLSILAATACSRRDKELTVGAVTYNFPADEVFRFTNPGEGHPYARIRPRGEDFDLIYSEFAKYRQNHQGGGTPMVTSINDYPRPRFYQFRSDTGMTVCAEPQPYYSCGIQLNDNGVIWSVVFNKDQRQKSDSIRAAGFAALARYRVSPKSR